jgi:hypothetical protein
MFSSYKKNSKSQSGKDLKIKKAEKKFATTEAQSPIYIDSLKNEKIS